MKFLNCLFFIGLTLGVSSVFAAEYSVKETSKIFISGHDAQVIILNSAQTAGTKIGLDAQAEADFLFEETEQGIRLTRKSAETSTDKKTKGKIEISGKQTPIEVHLIEGSITATKWTKDLFLHLQQGKINLKENQSTVVVHSQKGEATIVDHKGKVIVDSLQTSVSIKELNGDLDLQSYQGDVVLDSVKGNLILHTTNGAAKILKGSGSVLFETGKGSINSQNFLGRIEGQTNDGQVQVALQAGQDVNVRTQTGKVTIATLPNSGALLNVTTIDGEIYGPAYLKVARDGSQKTLKGRLKGENSESTIQVRSQDGTVIIK